MVLFPPTMQQTDPMRQVAQAARAVRAAWQGVPRAGIILGTGLGGLAAQLEVHASIDYSQIPHFWPTTALGHAGRLLCGTLAGTPVVTMEGRLHRYEGYSLEQITLPVRVMRQLGAELLVISNASGGVSPWLRSGDLVVIQDHINLLWGNPLQGTEAARELHRGERVAPYDAGLIQRALGLARAGDFAAFPGVYAALAGPNYETRAEYRLLRRIGADVVGMSTVPEATVASRLGLRVLALSAVTNVCCPDQPRPTTAAEVVAAAESTEPKMRAIVAGLLQQLA